MQIKLLQNFHCTGLVMSASHLSIAFCNRWRSYLHEYYLIKMNMNQWSYAAMCIMCCFKIILHSLNINFDALTEFACLDKTLISHPLLQVKASWAVHFRFSPCCNCMLIVSHSKSKINFSAYRLRMRSGQEEKWQKGMVWFIWRLMLCRGHISPSLRLLT
jgi:hypothetical protein